MDSANSTIMYGGNASFMEALYEDYLHDPYSVDQEWRGYFDQLRTLGVGGDIPHSPIQHAFLEMAQNKRGITLMAAGEKSVSKAPSKAPETYGISALIGAYRLMGHLRANINPLKLRPTEQVPELELNYYGLSSEKLEIQITDGGFEGTLAQVLEQVRSTYCGSIGFEYAYLPRLEREWLQDRIERGLGRANYTPEQKKRFLSKLTAAEGLERHLHITYVGQKRFSLEGSETLISVLDTLILHAGQQGVKELVIGMAHRGRLNVLVNTFGKKPGDLFKEFEGKKVYNPDISGDVKYHMGFSSDVQTEGGPVHLALAFNPSHLEIVNPVVEGSVRARQDRRGALGRREVLPVVIHGDAAVVGQGVVAETLNLSKLRGFGTGGTVHIVVNNQVGFTISDPRDTRSSRYCTDIAKFIDAPVFHVNGDDPEACAFATQLALEYRATWGKDVFVDVIAYRKHGHNEGDEPLMTQPMMYRQIKAHPGSRALYAAKLEAEGTLVKGEAEAMVASYGAALLKGDAVTEALDSNFKAENAANWKPFLGKKWTEPSDTAVSLERLREVGQVLTRIPEGFMMQRAVEREIAARAEMMLGNVPFNWGMAENLAYGTLVTEGHRVRISGQDSGRGTFVHRHAVWHDQASEDVPEGETYCPLEHLSEGQAPFEVIDSTLSEEAVLAFEYGYTSTEPDALVVWEAQFGDFANGAQAVIDQFISAGESKWQRLSGVVMMLPHGYEGQGPEHSSARLERFLQLCAEDNMQVVVPSTPAQMFHMLRRQVVREYRAPLIIMSPKSMLRNKMIVSSLEDLTEGRFQLVIPDTALASGVDPKIDRVVVCSGKVYWELLEAREKAALKNVALVRLEQLYPFPSADLTAALAAYPNAKVVWTQEEPHNQGAWFTIRDNLEGCLAVGQRLCTSSRPASAAPAVGYNAKHVQQQLAVLNGALGLE